MKYESNILKRLIDTYGVIGNPRYLSEIIKEFIVRGKELYPHLFTYQSDWLAHIDEFGLTSDYVVSYTGQQIYTPHSKEKPVKRAILTGQTLVNVNIGFISTWGGTIVDNSKVTSINRKVSNWEFDKTMFKANTKYMIIYTCNSNIVNNRNNDIAVFVDSGTSGYGSSVNGVNSFTFITGTLLDTELVKLGISTESECDITLSDIMVIEYKEGMENWDIPYFEGMQSVKMPVLTTTGKNLFNCTNVEDINNSYTVVNMNSQNYITTDTLVEKGKQYTLSLHANISGATGNILSLGYMNYSNIVGGVEKASHNIVTINDVVDKTTSITFTAQTTDYIKLYIATGKSGYNVVLSNVQIEEGSVATSYEPHKTNILSCNEEVILRGIGDVKDTLDLTTGELTQRIGEIVLDGSEDWVIHQGSKFKMVLTNPGKNHGGVINCISDKLPSRTYGESIIMNNIEGVSVSDKYLGINKAEYSENLIGFKEWLRTNPITVQYYLTTESIKTVDLTIVDQDNQTVNKLSTFEGGTHFTTSSQDGSLLPSLTVDVVTDLEETLMVCSLEGNTM